MYNNCFGFTLIEFITVSAIIAILVSLGLPAYHRHMAAQEARTIPHILTIHIQKAKSEAVMYRHNVIICPSHDTQTCSDDWSNGLIMFLDQNRNRERDLDEKILSATQWNTRYGSLHWRGTLHANNLMFKAGTGLPIASNGSFYYCSEKTANKKLVLSRMGHIRHEQVNDCTL